MKKHEYKILLFRLELKDFISAIDAARDLKDHLNVAGSEGYKIVSSTYDTRTNVQVCIFEKHIAIISFEKVKLYIQDLIHKIENKIELYRRGL